MGRKAPAPIALNAAEDGPESPFMTKTIRMSTAKTAPTSSRHSTLAGKIVVINGATGALGSAMARALQAEEAQLVLFGRRLDRLTVLADELGALARETGRVNEPLIQPVDFSGAAPEDYDQLAAAIDEAFGRVDILINAMGQAGEPTPLAMSDLMKFQESLHVNFTAPFGLTRMLWFLLERSDDGQVLFFTDRGTPAFGNAYTLAHAAMARMVEQWANESTSVRVNALDPGPTASALRKYRFPGEHEDERAGPEAMLDAALTLLQDSGASGRIVRLQTQEPPTDGS